MFAQIAAHLTVAATSVPVDPTPSDNSVVAGWGGFAVFMFLLIAVILIGWSLVRQLKKVQKAEDDGKFDPSDKKPRKLTIN